jgi:hypothetical protein
MGVVVLRSEVGRLKTAISELQNSIDTNATVVACNGYKEIEKIEEFDKFDIDWFLLKLAIVKVESGFNPGAVNERTKAGGLFQIMPSGGFLCEANRITGAKYVDSCRFDPKASTEIFEIVNRRHNRERSVEKAIRLHNPTAGEWYTKRVLKEYELLKSIAYQI